MLVLPSDASLVIFKGGLRPPYFIMSKGICIVLSSDAVLSVERSLVIFEGGLRPPYFLMALGFCFVLSSGALLSVGCCLVLLLRWPSATLFSNEQGDLHSVVI